MSNEDPVLEEDGAAEDVGTNRTFLIAAAGLGIIFIIALIAIVGVVFLWRPAQQSASLTQIAARQAENAAIEATNSAIQTEAARPTDTPPPTDTPVPSDTPVPTETPAPPTETPAPPSETPAPTDTAGTPEGPAQATASPTRLGGTAAATGTGVRTATPIVGALTRTPATATATPRQLSNTGFADDLGLPGLIALALGLVAVVIIVRRLRVSLR